MRMSDFPGWEAYEDAIYAVYLETVAHARLTFCGSPLKVRFKPETKKKGYGFWHLISEASDQRNRNEEDRLPDLQRCERVRWVAWCIQHADAGTPGFSWWENERRGETHVVLWAEAHDYAVILAKRKTQQGPRYYLLKTAYCLHSRTVRKFEKERDAWNAKKTEAPTHCCVRASDTPSTHGR
ncbi:hypothetical protein CO614_05615 [Lysobacteraceae bacterium NML120232]|nr:hypothetical protein CO614_05615 [Xanthomonadaceae bacterium NML120232]